MPIGEELNIGIYATPSGDLLNTRCLLGRSTLLGDGADEFGNTSRAEEGVLGYDFDGDSTTRRAHLLVKAGPLGPKAVGSVVLASHLSLAVIESNFTNFATDYGEEVRFGLWSVKADSIPVDMGSATFGSADTSPSVSFTTPGVGTGDVRQKLAQLVWTRTQHQAGVAYNAIKRLIGDVRAETARAALRSYEPVFVLKPEYTLIAGREAYIRLDDPAGVSDENLPHSYWWVLKQERGSFYLALASDPTRYDPNTYQDPNTNEIDTGIASPGNSNSWKRVFFVNNGTDGGLPNNWIIGPQGHVISVTQPAAPGARRLKRARVLPNTGTSRARSGTVQARHVGGTYQAWFRPKGEASFSQLTKSGGGTTGAFGSSVTWQIDGKDAFTIDDKAFDTTIALTSGEIWEFELFADTRVDPEATLAPERHEIAPYLGQFDAGVADDPASAWEARRVKLGDAWVVKMTAAPDNGGPGGVARIYITDATLPGLEEDAWITVATADEESVGYPKVERLQIDSITASGADGTGDVIICKTALATPGNFSAGDHAGTGVYLGAVAANARGFLATDAGESAWDVGDLYVDVQEAPPFTSGAFRVTQLPDPTIPGQTDAGVSQRLPFTASGTRLTFTGGNSLAHAFRAGALVEYEQTGHFAHFYLRLSIEAGASRGPQRTRIRRVSVV